EWSGAALRLSLPPAALAAWADARLPELGAGDLPEVLRAAALEALLAEAVAALAPVSSSGPVHVLPEPRDTVLPHAWTLTARAPRAWGGRGHGLPGLRDTVLPHAWTWTARAAARGETALVVLEADDLGLLLLAGLLGRLSPAQVDALDETALPVRLRAQIGRA